MYQKIGEIAVEENLISVDLRNKILEKQRELRFKGHKQEHTLFGKLIQQEIP